MQLCGPPGGVPGRRYHRLVVSRTDRRRRPTLPVLLIGAVVGVLILLSLIGGFIAFVDALSGDDEATPAGTQPVAQRGAISRAAYGTQWPFTVPQGVLQCSDGAVTFTAAGKRYALNGAARRQGFASVYPIHANDEDTGFAKDLAPVVNHGLELC
jgi:hypothetical protein